MKNKIWGLVLIAIGLIFGLNALEITNIDIFFDGWWTLFIIVPCFIGLITEREKTGNLIGLLVGISLLLGCLDILEFETIGKLIFPVILVIIGLSILFKDTITREVTKEIDKLNDKREKENEYCSTFSSQTINIDDEFKGCDLTTVFGGMKFDLSEAKINEDVVINATTVFGGITINAPKGAKIKVKSNSIFGGVTNKSTANDGNTVYVNCFCLFGGVEIYDSNSKNN